MNAALPHSPRRALRATVPRKVSTVALGTLMLAASTVNAAPPTSALPPPGTAGAPSTNAGPTTVGGTSTPASAPAPGEGSCVERLPTGRARPPLREEFPHTLTAGHVATLTLELDHLPGERVLPSGIRLEGESLETEALERAQFALPHPESPAAPTLERTDGEDSSKTRLTLPVIPLPKAPGRQELVLPALPIVLSRASGEVFTLCTAPHPVTVESPTANEPEPKPRGLPEPRRQLEVWRAAQEAVAIGLIALVVGAMLAWLFLWWRRRPRPAPPPPPPRPPWEVALEALDQVRRENLIDREHFDEHFDRVSMTLREYLGERYGFDGLESTSREALRRLGRIEPPVRQFADIKRLLRQADLVKFARLTPTADECRDFWAGVRAIVEGTIPAPVTQEERR